MEVQRAHCTELPATGQPWHLVLFKGDEPWGRDSRIRRLDKTMGIILGCNFLGGAFNYLFRTAVIRLTMTGARRGVGDVIAVGFYLVSVLPLFGIALLVRGLVQGKKIWLHAAFVACSSPRQQRRSFDGSHAAAYSGENLSALVP